MRRAIRAVAIPSLAALCLAGLAPSANAASGSLRITAIDRSGKATPATAWVTNLKTNAQYHLTSGKLRKLPNGRYGVMIVIAPDGITYGGTQTLGGGTVSVRGNNATMRFDARQGKLIEITPNTGQPQYFSYDTVLCIGGTYMGGMASFYGLNGMSNYVIPSTNKDMLFSYSASWTESSSQGPYYWAVGRPTRGIPSHPVYSYAHAKFAKLSIKVLKGKIADPSTALMVLPAGPSAPCTAGGISYATFNAPRTVTAYVSTGDWSSYIVYSNNSKFTNGPIAHYVAGRTYHLTFDRS